MQAHYGTRMHSSRMRTGRSLTICLSLLPGGGGEIPKKNKKSKSKKKKKNQKKITMTDRCKNITLATTSLRPVKIVECIRVYRNCIDLIHWI